MSQTTASTLGGEFVPGAIGLLGGRRACQSDRASLGVAMENRTDQSRPDRQCPGTRAVVGDMAWCLRGKRVPGVFPAAISRDATSAAISSVKSTMPAG